MADKQYRDIVRPIADTPVEEGVLLGEIVRWKENLPTALAIFTDKAVLETTAGLLELLDSELPRLLEVRLFGEDAELHAVRTAMGDEFKGRIAEDAELESGSFLDERQLLDIVRNDGGHCITVGGGAFDLPAGSENATRIKIRNYIEYDADGLAQVVDFRIVGLE